MSVIAYAIFTSCQGKNIKVCGLSVFFLNQFFNFSFFQPSAHYNKVSESAKVPGTCKF